MSVYGSAIPRKGRELIAAILAAGLPLELTKIMVGKGRCPEGTYPGDLEDLIDPVAEGTSTIPYVDGDTVKLTVEYRSDLNGGLEHGFWLDEFGVFARGENDTDVMVFYGTLGDYPQWVCALAEGIDTRRFDVQITIGEGATVIIHYTPCAIITPDDLREALARSVTGSQYSDAATYSAGDYCSRDGKMYRCLQDIAVPEPWTPEHWEETSVPGELARIESSVNGAMQTMDNMKRDIIAGFIATPLAAADGEIICIHSGEEIDAVRNFS